MLRSNTAGNNASDVSRVSCLYYDLIFSCVWQAVIFYFVTSLFNCLLTNYFDFYNWYLEFIRIINNLTC